MDYWNFSDDPFERNGYFTDKAVILTILINHINI